MDLDTLDAMRIINALESLLKEVRGLREDIKQLRGNFAPSKKEVIFDDGWDRVEYVGDQLG